MWQVQRGVLRNDAALAPAASVAPIAFVNAVRGGNTSNTNSIVATAQAVTAGNLLVGFFRKNGTAVSVTGVTDTAGNTGWTKAIGSGIRIEIWYVWNCLGHATNVATAAMDGNSVYRAFTIYQFSGIKTSGDPLLDSDQDLQTGTTASTPSLTITGTNALVLAMLDGNPTLSGGAGYTFTKYAITGDAAEYFGDEYKIVTASSAPSATNGGGGQWAMSSAMFNGL